MDMADFTRARSQRRRRRGRRVGLVPMLRIPGAHARTPAC